MDKKFKEWYEKNKSYYFVKHSGDEQKMEVDAIQSYNMMKSFTGKPSMQSKSGEVKKKANQYGF